MNNDSLTLTLAFTLLKDKLLYYILHLEIIYLVILTKTYFPFCFSLQFYNPKCSLAALITEKSVQMKYISELVSDPSPIIYKWQLSLLSNWNDC